MISNNKKIIIIIALSIIGLLTTFMLFYIASRISVKVIKTDTNNDNKIDTWQYFTNGKKFKEALDTKYNGEIDTWIFWNKDGSLKELVTTRTNGKKNHYYYQAPTVFYRNGKELLRSELDYEKTYKTNLSARKNKSIKYTDNGEIIYGENDLLGHGVIDTVSYYKSNRIYMITSDNNGDGTIDVWTYYENGKLVRSEYDSNGDGKPDKQGLPPMDDKYKVTHKIEGAR